MKTLLSLTATFCLLFTNVNGQQTINGSISHDGLTREYILYVPANYTGNTAVPLLFNFHGYTSNASQQLFYGDFRPISDTAGFIIVHPEGTLDGNGVTHFNVGWGGSSVDDVGFTEALIDSLSAQYAINQERIYSTGMSNGGFMSFKLACELSDRFAAVGSVTGSILPATLNNCNALHPTPIIQIHGTNDGTVPYDGGAGWSEPITSLVDYWANFNNCVMPAQIENVPNTNTSDGSTVEKYSYLSGDNCTEVVHFKITNGDHTWPGTAFNSPGTNYDIDASAEVWNFLSQYDINGLINCENADASQLTPSPTLALYPNPTEHVLYVDGVEDLNEFQYAEISELSGQVVLSKANLSGGIDVSALSSGVYFIHIKNAEGTVSMKFAKK